MIRAIEEEFDEPLADIVIGMREQGCSWRTIAGALDISILTLRKWRKELGFAPSDGRRILEEGSWFSDSIVRSLGYRDFTSMYYDLRLSKKMTVKQISDYTGISTRTIEERTPASLKGMEIKTEKKVAAAKKNLERARGRMKAIRDAREWKPPYQSKAKNYNDYGN